MKAGWTYKKLGEVVKPINGLWKGKKEPFVHVGVIRNANFTKDFTLNFDNIEYLDVEQRQYATRKLKKGDLIVEKSGGSEKQPVGRAVLFLKDEGEFSFSNFTSVLRITDANSLSYLFLYKYLLFVYKRGDTKKMQNAATGIHNIIWDMYLGIDVPILSISEQERIVAYLDTQFAKIDAMKANAAKALAEAKALFQSALTEAMTPKEGWKEKTLGEICEIIRGKRFVRNDIIEEGVPCIHYGDIYTYYGLSAIKTKGCISHELAKKMRFALKNDVVVVAAGENPWDIGVGVAYLGNEPAAVHDACFILRHKQNPMFVSYYLRTQKYHRFLLDFVHEGKICSFLKPALDRAPFSYPPLPEQERIVAQLEALSGKVAALEANYTQTVAECDALKQALLREVFE